MTEIKCEYVTRLEVQAYLNISAYTFYEHFAKKLPAYKIGKRFKYKLSDVDKLVKRINPV